MADTQYLVDTSVLGRAHQAEVGELLEDLAGSGRMWSCSLVDLEVLSGSRAKDVGEVLDERNALPSAPIDDSVIRRALQVAALLARSGKHRGAKPVDLVIAAAAEAKGLTVLHYDSDFDRISAITRQPTKWVAKAGALDR